MTDCKRLSDAERRRATRDIYKIIILRVVWAVILLQAVLAPYFVGKGVALPDVFLIQMIFSLSLIVGELPTGILADLIGRRSVLILATILRGLGATGLIVFDGFWGMAISYIFIGFANNSLSGADIAAIVERHRLVAGGQKTLQWYLGRQKTFEFLAMTVSALAGGYIASHSLELAGILNMIFAWVAFPIALSISRDEPVVHALKPSRPLKATTAELIRAMTQLLLQKPVLLILILAIASFSFLSSICAYAYQTAWITFGYSSAIMGMLYATRNLSAAAAAWVTNGVTRSIGFAATIIISSLAAIAAFALATYDFMIAAVCSLLLIGIMDGTAKILLIPALNAGTQDSYRATLNSLYNFVSRILIVVVAPVLAVLTRRFGASYPFYLLVGVSSLIFIVLVIPFLFLQQRETITKSK
jgi:hypothetical protein